MQLTVPTLLRIKPDATHRLGKYLSNWQKVTVLLAGNLTDWSNQVLNVAYASAGIKVLHQQDVTSNALTELTPLLAAIPSQTQAIVAIGGGRVIDGAKYAGHVLSLPVVAVPTAISNDGFASPFSSVVINGQRRTLPTVMPWGVVIDTRLIQQSPRILTLSGVGDLISKATALPDWKLAYHQAGTPVNDFAWSLARMTFDRWLALPDKSIDSLEHLTVLANALLFSGLSMALAGNSRPASGAEHLISHAYDQLAQQQALAASLHGLQVGVATYAVAGLYDVQDVVRQALEQTGFFNAVAEKPLNRDCFLKSIQQAHTIKPGFTSALSDPAHRQQVCEFINSDPLCQRLLI